MKYDPVTEKIAIPIYDEFGRLRVVIGRHAHDDQWPRYVPLVPESGAKFKDVLYGLYEIRDSFPVEIYVTEGYWGVYRINISI